MQIKKFKLFKLNKLYLILAQMGKAFLLPIALLPIAGIFQGIGGTIAQACLDKSQEFQNAGWYIGMAMKSMGAIAFTNLPVLFAISIAIAFTNDAGVAGITALIAFLAFNALQSAFLTEFISERGTWKLLFYNRVDQSQLTQNLGINSLNTGVFAAIFIGFIAAYCYKRFYKVQLPNWIGFFSGTKLVPIITFIVVIPVSFLFMLTWPPIGFGLSWIGNASSKMPNGLDSFFYQFLARSLLPFGLHHIINNVLWYNAPGGDLIALLKANPDFVSTTNQSAQAIIDAIVKSGANVMGDQNIFLWMISGQDLLNFSEVSHLGLNVGRFLSGRYAINLLGLPLASIGMWLTLPKQNRKKVLGMYLSSMIACILTGITEPIEYTFLFVAPWLFYGVHVPLAALTMLLSGAMQIHTGSVVAAGLIDFILYSFVPLITNPNLNNNIVHFSWIIPLVGVVYFACFYGLVKYFKVDIPGRKDDHTQKLYTKSDYTNQKEHTKQQQAIIKATKIITCVGGPTNIISVDACASRLRIVVVEQNLVDKPGIIALGGCKGIMLTNNYLQAVYGAEQEILKQVIKELLVEPDHKQIESSQLW